MKLLLVAVLAVFAAVLLLSQPAQGQFLGNGGVFNSPAAQAYWKRRFGSGVFSAARRAGQLARAQQGSNSISSNEIVGSKEQFRSSKPRFSRPSTIRYVPTFKGTYGKPSAAYRRYLLNRNVIAQRP